MGLETVALNMKYVLLIFRESVDIKTVVAWLSVSPCREMSGFRLQRTQPIDFCFGGCLCFYISIDSRKITASGPNYIVPAGGRCG